MNIQLTPFPDKYDKSGLEQIAEWRNQSMISLRSTSKTNPEKQGLWYDKVIHDQTVRYFYIYNTENVLIGYCGLDKISTVNKTAEIGLLINPELHKSGYGRAAVKQLLKVGFAELNLNCIFAEVYATTHNWDFWRKVGFVPEGMLRERKLWNGKFYPSIIGSILKSDWRKNYEQTRKSI